MKLGDGRVEQLGASNAKILKLQNKCRTYARAKEKVVQQPSAKIEGRVW